MGLFQKKQLPVASILYTVGDQHLKAVFGLGNVGKEYILTRHNAGFLCLDQLVEELGGSWREKKSLKSFVAEVRLGDKRLLCIKPTTLMNLSGDAAAAVKQFYKLSNKDILVVHDELDMPFGTLRLRLDGGSAGHNGIKSVSAAIGEDYARLRIGVKNDQTPKTDAADFVLKPFAKAEQASFSALYKEVSSLVSEFAYSESLLPDTRSFI